MQEDKLRLAWSIVLLFLALFTGDIRGRLLGGGGGTPRHAVLNVLIVEIARVVGGGGEDAGISCDDDDDGVGHEEPEGGVLEEGGGWDVEEGDVEEREGDDQNGDGQLLCLVRELTAGAAANDGVRLGHLCEEDGFVMGALCGEIEGGFIPQRGRAMGFQREWSVIVAVEDTEHDDLSSRDVD